MEALGQYTVRVEFTADPSRTTVVGCFRRGDVVYASLTDLASVFKVSTYENLVTHKFELKQPPFRIKVTGANPFVTVTDESGHETAYQLPQDVLFAAHSYFVPLQPFLPLFSVAFGPAASFDASRNVLTIGQPVTASLFDIPAIRLEPKSNGLLVRIAARKRLSDYENWLRSDGWLYVTVANARADTHAINATPPAGIVKEVIAIQSPTSVQLTLRLAAKVAAAAIVQDDSSDDLLLSIRTVQTREETAPEKKSGPAANTFEDPRKRWQLDVIVLDPGHGGYDPGTIGITGVKEKNVSLGIVLKLGRLIAKNLPGVTVVYTRKTDRFVELDRRGTIANEAGGKLFISVHCNALPRKPSKTRGFEVYLLRPGRTEEAIAIAERENSVIELEEGYEERYKKLTEENFILVTMAQSAHVRASEEFADLTQKELASRTKLPNRGVKQAGFYVLVGAAMPNILVETAYLSNREDERFLKSEAGQQKIAEALFRAVKKYKEEYEKVLREGKDISAGG